MMVCRHIKPFEFNSMIGRLTRAIVQSGENYSCVVGLSRGGLVPAVHLSHSLGLPMYTLEKSVSHPECLTIWTGSSRWHNMYAARGVYQSRTPDKMLFVDEICDSGDTIESIQRQYPAAEIDFAVLINNVDLKQHPRYTAYSISRKTDHRWFVFPWENPHTHENEAR